METNTLPECWNTAIAVLKHSRLSLLTGPPGVGKTYAAVKAAEGSALYSVTLTAETPAAELRGHYIPKDGSFHWHDGPAVKAWREGATLVVNEIDHAGGDALDLMMVLLDDPETARLTLPTGETIVPAAGFRAVATMNGDPADLPEALADRLTVHVHIDIPNPAAVASLPTDLRPLAERLGGVTDDRRLSMRALFAFADLREKMTPELAASACFGYRGPEVIDALRAASVGGA